VWNILTHHPLFDIYVLYVGALIVVLVYTSLRNTYSKHSTGTVQPNEQTTHQEGRERQQAQAVSRVEPVPVKSRTPQGRDYRSGRSHSARDSRNQSSRWYT
jgi:hypothetical protein